MIYIKVKEHDPIKQGDIFCGIPKAEVSLSDLVVVKETYINTEDWSQYSNSSEPVPVVIPLRPVTGIVISQDCDNTHGEYISFSEIRSFKTVERKSKDTIKPKSWMKIITQQARKNQKWFYLPPDSNLGFEEKLGVDFQSLFQVKRKDLINNIHFRVCRLNELADEHFRERISQFFRRYPYDEWYNLSKEEFELYKKEYKRDVVAFDWQK